MCVRDLTSGVSVHPEYSTGNKGQKVVWNCSVAEIHGFLHCMQSASILMAHVFSRIHACVVPRVLHFSSFIAIALLKPL